MANISTISTSVNQINVNDNQPVRPDDVQHKRYFESVSNTQWTKEISNYKAYKPGNLTIPSQFLTDQYLVSAGLTPQQIKDLKHIVEQLKVYKSVEKVTDHNEALRQLTLSEIGRYKADLFKSIKDEFSEKEADFRIGLFETEFKLLTDMMISEREFNGIDNVYYYQWILDLASAVKNLNKKDCCFQFIDVRVKYGNSNNSDNSAHSDNGELLRQAFFAEIDRIIENNKHLKDDHKQELYKQADLLKEGIKNEDQYCVSLFKDHYNNCVRHLELTCSMAPETLRSLEGVFFYNRRKMKEFRAQTLAKIEEENASLKERLQAIFPDHIKEFDDHINFLREAAQKSGAYDDLVSRSFTILRKALNEGKSWSMPLAFQKIGNIKKAVDAKIKKSEREAQKNTATRKKRQDLANKGVYQEIKMTNIFPICFYGSKADFPFTFFNYALSQGVWLCGVSLTDMTDGKIKMNPIHYFKHDLAHLDASNLLASEEARQCFHDIYFKVLEAIISLKDSDQLTFEIQKFEFVFFVFGHEVIKNIIFGECFKEEFSGYEATLLTFDKIYQDKRTDFSNRVAFSYGLFLSGSSFLDFASLPEDVDDWMPVFDRYLKSHGDFQLKNLSRYSYDDLESFFGKEMLTLLQMNLESNNKISVNQNRYKAVWMQIAFYFLLKETSRFLIEDVKIEELLEEK